MHPKYASCMQYDWPIAIKAHTHILCSTIWMANIACPATTFVKHVYDQMTKRRDMEQFVQWCCDVTKCKHTVTSHATVCLPIGRHSCFNIIYYFVWIFLNYCTQLFHSRDPVFEFIRVSSHYDEGACKIVRKWPCFDISRRIYIDLWHFLTYSQNKLLLLHEMKIMHEKKKRNSMFGL